MAPDLTGQVAVITGGASGIGRACALAFARCGADIAVADLNNGRLADTAAAVSALGRRVVTARCDVTSDADVDAFAAQVSEELGRADLVMLNAGVSLLGPPDRIPMADWHRQFEVNFFGIVRGVNAFVPGLRAQGRGRVIITASIAGRYAYTYDAGPYIASKHAAYGYAENLALYLRPQGVGVTVVCPGLVETNLGENAWFAGVDPSAGYVWFPDHMLAPLSSDAVAELVVDAVEHDRFLVYTHPADADLVRERAADVDAALARQLAAMPDPTPPDETQR